MKKQIKKMGFWKEEGYPNAPSYKSCINSGVPLPRKLPWFIFFYLQNSPMLAMTLGWQESTIDGTRMSGEIIRTDGVWVWSDTIIHYYEQNGVELPKDFVKYLKRKITPYPLLFSIKVLISKKPILQNIMKELTEEFTGKSRIPPQEPYNQ